MVPRSELETLTLQTAKNVDVLTNQMAQLMLQVSKKPMRNDSDVTCFTCNLNGHRSSSYICHENSRHRCDSRCPRHPDHRCNSSCNHGAFVASGSNAIPLGSKPVSSLKKVSSVHDSTISDKPAHSKKRIAIEDLLNEYGQNPRVVSVPTRKGLHKAPIKKTEI